MNDILLLINSISDNPTRDELDVLVQAEAVEKALKELGISTRRAFLGMDLDPLAQLLRENPPWKVFNLVETVGGMGALIHVCTSLLEAFRIPFTGSGTYALLTTTDKVRTKIMLERHGLPTPRLIQPGSSALPEEKRKYILKPVWEDGSAGINDESLYEGKDIDLQELKSNGLLKHSFLEEYIEGREFNLSVLAGERGPEVMPVAEMLYVDYPQGKPKILNFASKWDEDSFEYHNTVRSFELSEADSPLAREMREISLECFQLFEMQGYARVDFRVDSDNRPYVLEVNANPCIAQDAGFTAACQQGGLSYKEMINRIINAVQ